MSHLDSRLSLRHLRLIDAIEREGSLARAAGSLHMTQSAVTKALQDAEALAGVALFARTNRGAIPTPHGALLVGHARTVLAQLRRAAREMAELKDGTGGSVAVGALPSAAGGLVPDAVARVLAGQPRLRITIVEGQHEQLTTLLRRGDLDLVVGRLSPRRRPPDIAEDILGVDRARLVVRAGHPLAGRSGLGLPDLRDLRWILPPPETTIRRQIDAAFEGEGLEPPLPAVESISSLSSRTLLLAADFIAVWPQHLAEVEARSGLITLLPVDLPATDRPIGLWWRTDAPLSAAAQLLAAAMREGFDA